MNVRTLLLSIVLSAVPVGFLTAQDPSNLAHKSEIQLRAEALMQKARKLSDIRAKNAPAFRLKATFSFVGKNLENEQGTYTEIWVSDSRWRREIVLGDLHRLEILPSLEGGHPDWRDADVRHGGRRGRTVCCRSIDC